MTLSHGLKTQSVFFLLIIQSFWNFPETHLGRGGRNRLRENLGIAKIGVTPPPYPNPGTLVESTTKARKCDSRHFDDKSV